MAAHHGVTIGAVSRWNPDPHTGDRHHRRYDDDILRGLRLPPDGRILDLGCGAGALTARLAGLVPRGEVLAVDADRDMVAAARLRSENPRLSFQVCHARDVAALAGEESFDVVVSRAALHRIPGPDHPAVLSAVFSVLRPGGVFRAEFAGAGQIAALLRILDAEVAARGGSTAPWFLPGPEDYRPLLLDAGFQVNPDGWVCLLHQRRAFRTETDLIRLLRGQLLLAYEDGLPVHAVAEFRRTVEERAIRELRRADGSFDQDFVRLDLSAHRPKAESLI
jgi:trans-aconitate 2-methyltransferase